jgi:hypothetical protein
MSTAQSARRMAGAGALAGLPIRPSYRHFSGCRAVDPKPGRTHTVFVRILDEFLEAANGLGYHPQDHGWRSLYRLFSHGLHNYSPQLTGVLLAHQKQRPVLSATHSLTLLGIALKVAAPGPFGYVSADGPADARLGALEEIILEHRVRIGSILNSRQNSFTSARRFLLPQVLLSAYFAVFREGDVNFADLGTGLGVLPRQLDSARQYKAFARDLVWPGGIPEFREISLASRLGADRGPLPDLDWVRSCHGQSDYYRALYGELVDSFSAPDIAGTEVRLEELDILEPDAMAHFIRRHHINAANLGYVLYELERGQRAEVIDMLVRELRPPGVLIVTEPHNELHGQGAVVELFHNGSRKPHDICFVSDGHFKGHVIPLDDYDKFTRDYPITYE